jgi:WXXGXW repeat (2 copies)
MLVDLSPSRRLLQASLILLLSSTAGPAFAAPLDLLASNIAPTDARSVVAPALPVPTVAFSAPPLALLEAARRALAGARTGEAQEALERAETRLLVGTAQPVLAAPSMVPALASARAARQALAGHDRAGAAREIDAAIAALSAAAAATVVFPPPVAAPTPRQPAAPMVVAAIPPGPPPVTEALLPGRWELRGAKYVWVPPDTDLRRVDERPWQQGRYVWRDGVWVWMPAHYGLE